MRLPWVCPRSCFVHPPSFVSPTTFAAMPTSRSESFRQPVPNPVAWWLHFLPPALLSSAVAINHFVELVAPFLLLMSRGPCAVGGILQILFQVWNYCAVLCCTVGHQCNQ